MSSSTLPDPAPEQLPRQGVFRSLRVYNYRLWAMGAIVSNIGTWMQRTAQDWLVLTELSSRNATAVGAVMACQYGPLLLMLPWSGFAADHFNRRRLIIATQAAMGLLALVLGLLTIFHVVTLWEVLLLAFLQGCVQAFDSTARQTFVAEMVGEADLSNAVGLNSTSFNASRLIGPAVAGISMAAVGTGWMFILNAVSFGAVLLSLFFFRVDELYPQTRVARTPGSFIEGFRYAWQRPDLKAILFMLLLVGTFALNFPIYIATMSVSVFGVGASQFGLLTSAMAVGSVSGAFLSARRQRPNVGVILGGAILMTFAFAFAAFAPTYALFGVGLAVLGLSTQTFMNTSNALVQMSTEPKMRGRVIAILLALAVGGTPVGAPIAGWVADALGPRWALGVGLLAGVAATVVGVLYLVRFRNLRVRFSGVRPRFTVDEAV